jgi:hypothetical protein
MGDPGEGRRWGHDEGAIFTAAHPTKNGGRTLTEKRTAAG